MRLLTTGTHAAFAASGEIGKVSKNVAGGLPGLFTQTLAKNGLLSLPQAALLLIDPTSLTLRIKFIQSAFVRL